MCTPATEDLYRRIRRPIVNLGEDFPQTTRERLEDVFHAIAGRPLPNKADRIFDFIREEEDEGRAAQRIGQAMGAWGLTELITERLRGRARQVANQVGPYLAGGTTLDFGCGDGRVGFEVQRRTKVTLFDTVDYRAPETREAKLPFFSSWGDLRGRRFNFAIVSAVLHHCDFPARELQRLAEVADTLLVIESVISPLVPAYDQAFFDWLYNRGLHPGAAIPVPGSFGTVPDWRLAFHVAGYDVETEVDYGIDVPIVPEHHVLFVLNRRR